MALALGAVLGPVGGHAAGAPASIAFVDITDAAGVGDVTTSWGVAWGDLNGDGLPDAYTPSHATQPRLFVNQGGGRFEAVPSAALPIPDDADTHGAAWADADNDGDSDLVQLAGNESDPALPNHFLRNDRGVLTDAAAEVGLDYPLGAGRAPAWLDFDRDGRLDLLLPTHQRRGAADSPTALFRNTGNGFVDVTAASGLDLPDTSHFGTLGDLNGDMIPELIVQNGGYQLPSKVYDTSTFPFTEIRAALGLPQVRPARDAVIADLDGDLRNDLFVTGNEIPNGVTVDDDTVTARLQPYPYPGERGLVIHTTGDLDVRIKPGYKLKRLGWDHVFIGEAGWNPRRANKFSVESSDPSTWGIKAHVKGRDPGVYLGYDPAARAWTLRYVNPSGEFLRFELASSEAVDDVDTIGFDAGADGPPDHLFMARDGGFVDRTAAAGLGGASFDINAVAADFDNDMDLDLYVVRTETVANLPNRLYENQGDGTFVEVPGAGGAEGPIGAGGGHGDVVATADVDVDGFMDLFVTNGRKLTAGPNRLYRNAGNGNHWIQLDLAGIASNRDGLGATVVATAGGVRQLREQNGGSHERGAQNFRRIHFGLGPHTLVDLQITWPSGAVQTLRNVPADRVLRVPEIPDLVPPL